jgi:cell division control protein 12
LRIHACLYFIAPTGHGLSSLDVKVLKLLSTRVNVIPVVAKADTITPQAMLKFKQQIRETIQAHQIKIYQPPVEDDDEIDTAALIEAMPFGVIGSYTEVTLNGTKVLGREYPWGVAQVEDDAHCDFKKLRNLLIRTHLHDLISTTEEVHYETFLQGPNAKQLPPTVDMPAKMKQDEEALRKRFAEQVRLEETRFRQWEQKVCLTSY